MHGSRIIAGFVLASLTALSACDENVRSSVKLVVAHDLSAEVTTSSLSIPSVPSGLERGATGVDWDATAVVRRSKGRIKSLETGFAIADATFKVRVSGARRFMEVILPRAPGTKWASVLAPVEGAVLDHARAVLDPKGEAPDFGRVVKIELELPSDIRFQGCSVTKFATATHDGKKATLLVMIDGAAFEFSEPICWQLHWEVPPE